MTEATDLGSAEAAPIAGGANVAPPSRVDFERKVVCILGLPFDAIGVDGAVQRIRDAAFAGRRCFVSTPNLNFSITAREDPVFRGAVLRSDLSVVDGMPLVWIARLLGLPIRERVSGSDVFEALQVHPGPPLNVYLFGGPPGAAEQACDRINRRGGGVRCVGFDSAGFGSVESISGVEQIERINRSGAHFVVASLSAKKGQAWIEHNADRLKAPVLCHLGAVLNFAAGTIQRAPHWMRGSGLEWLWRIKEEPGLWRRYWNDGATAIGLLLGKVLPDALTSRGRSGQAIIPPRLEIERTRGGCEMRLHGSWTSADAAPFRSALTSSAALGSRVTVDLSGVTFVDSAFIALVLLASGWFGARGGFEARGASSSIRRTFRLKLAEYALAAELGATSGSGQH